jgi:hypothetical protein
LASFEANNNRYNVAPATATTATTTN